MKQAAAKGVAIYGECGGYMVLGESIEDAAGESASNARTFAGRNKLCKAQDASRLSPARTTCRGAIPGSLTGHEFHYASIVREGVAARLFRVRDALGEDLGEAGLRVGSVCGSYMHIIDLAG